MDLTVLESKFLPKKFLHREDKITELAVGVNSTGVITIIGHFGVGKTTLAFLALKGRDRVVFVDCSVKTTSSSIIYTLKKAMGGLLEYEKGWIIVLDDFTLARRDNRLYRLVKKLSENNTVLVIGHPSIRGELLALSSEKIIDMPPYNSEEIYDIVSDRVVTGNLNVEDSAVEFLAERIGYPRGSGNVRLALNILREAIMRFHKRISWREVEAIMSLLSLI